MTGVFDGVTGEESLDLFRPDFSDSVDSLGNSEQSVKWWECESFDDVDLMQDRSSGNKF